MPGAVATAPNAPDVVGRVREVAAACRALGRPELARALQAAAVRVQRPETLVCIVGEYKQGKSSLVNALLGVDVCPVDDDLATSALTAVGYSETPVAHVYRQAEGERIVEEIDVESVWEYASERGNPDNVRAVDLVEVGLPNPVLEYGLVLVDTPGVGGFRAAYAAAILGFLPLVDGIVLVSDASAELAAPELGFLRRAREASPFVLPVLTKIDLYPAWAQILALDRGHLAAAGLTVEPVAVSAHTRRWALDHQDAEVNNESGFPTLLEALQRKVVEPAKASAAQRALAEAERALSSLGDGLRSELAVLEDPRTLEEAVGRLAHAEDRLRSLREAGARWSTVLNDGMTDLRSEADYRLRTLFRATLAEADEKLATIDPAGAWDDFAEHLQAQIAEGIQGIFGRLYEEAASIGRRVADLIDEETLSLPVSVPAGPDLEPLPAALTRPGRLGAPKRYEWGLGALRGAQGGGFMVAWLAGVIGVTVAAPVALGVGAVFGAKYLADERKRQLERRRHEGRATVRQFIDATQLEAANRLQQSTLELHRALRDFFAGQIQQLQEASATTAQAIRRAAEREGAERDQRIEWLRATLSGLEELDHNLRREPAQAPR